ncbi:MAG: sulfate ABC transporter ATP-binding protein [Campylobacteraceae bacterium]|jgi:sulfate transport system ATP-binding protein|nr:sulfate ABC transporter ATP-binding protein [Campylobacteraceae bacterium]
MSIEVSHVNKKFGAFTALDDINLNIPNGELTALLGPSGSGKTTLLRIIAGLENPDSGEIRFFGQNTTNKPAKERKVGFVFQHYALFKHMSVFENIAFGLKIRPRSTRPDKNEIREKVFKLLKMVQLEPLANRLPSELSGGQRQRVALARALAVEPKVLLLDEPFGALDAKVRQELRRWLRYLHDEIHITSVFVTHDQEEALEVADKIVILNKGKIEQTGTPEDVYDNPVNPFVYGFLGNVNLFHARLEKGALRLDEQDAQKEDVSFFIRPHGVKVTAANEDGKSIEAKIITHRVLGSRVRVELKTAQGGKEIEADVDKKEWAAIKDSNQNSVYIQFVGAKIYTSDESWSDYVI